MASLFSEANLSYYTIPFAFGLALWPRFYSGLTGPGKKYFNPAQPRAFVNNLEKTEALDKKLRGRLIRAEGCGANAFEGLPLFAAAVTAGNVAQLSPEALNLFSLGYVASRVLYTWVYIMGPDFGKAVTLSRTPVWGIGVGCIMALFIKAGLKSQP